MVMARRLEAIQRAPKTRRLQPLADHIVRTCPATFFDIVSCANQGMPSKKIFLSRNNRGGVGVDCDYFAGVQRSSPKVLPKSSSATQEARPDMKVSER